MNTLVDHNVFRYEKRETLGRIPNGLSSPRSHIIRTGWFLLLYLLHSCCRKVPTSSILGPGLLPPSRPSLPLDLEKDDG